MRKALFAALCWLAAAAAARAGALPAPLEAAIQDAETRKAAAEEAGLEFTFTMHTVTAEDEFRMRYDPASEALWTLESPETKEAAKLRDRMAERAAEREQDEPGPDRRLLVGDLRELFGERVELAANGPQERVYRFDLSDKAQIGGGGRNFDASKYLTGELAIDAANRLRWLRFFAEKSFKPVLVARIDSFDLKMFVDPIWPDGPYVVVRQVVDMNGSAFFKSFAENVKTVYGDFEKR